MKILVEQIAVNSVPDVCFSDFLTFLHHFRSKYWSYCNLYYNICSIQFDLCRSLKWLYGQISNLPACSLFFLFLLEIDHKSYAVLFYFHSCFLMASKFFSQNFQINSHIKHLIHWKNLDKQMSAFLPYLSLECYPPNCSVNEHSRSWSFSITDTDVFQMKSKHLIITKEMFGGLCFHGNQCAGYLFQAQHT